DPECTGGFRVHRRQRESNLLNLGLPERDCPALSGCELGRAVKARIRKWGRTRERRPRTEARAPRRRVSTMRFRSKRADRVKMVVYDGTGLIRIFVLGS